MRQGSLNLPARLALTLAAASLLAGGVLVADLARANELVLPEWAERDGSIEVTYRFGSPVTGHGFIAGEWTDVLGRVVERLKIPLNLAGATEAVFSLDPKRAVTADNKLAIEIGLDETDELGKTIHREYRDAASFVVRPANDAWSDYQIVMWQSETPAGYAALKGIGVTGAMVEDDKQQAPGSYVVDQIKPMLAGDLHWYLENIATDFYSSYHRWTAHKPVDWRFREAKLHYWADPKDRSAFFREPSLSDPEWLGRIRARLTGIVGALRRYRPLFYNLADEPGIADLSAVWDFDFSPPSLAAMREWLKTRYGDLERLNKEWGTAFSNWDAVEPMTTADAVKGPDRNFAAWGDFKEWMDIAFARSLRSGTDAVHAADPRALSAIEGVQIPGWGGYDYSLLAHSVDVMELDDVEMMRSFDPDAVLLTTSHRPGLAEAHRVWRELLRGTRGLILWDRTGREFVDKDGNLAARAREAAAYYREIRGGLGALLINSQRHTDPVAILYSPASMRLEWLLDIRRSGEDWTRRSADSELEDTPARVSLRNYAGAIEHMGLHPRFASDDQLQTGELLRGGYRVMVLPRTIALSPKAAAAIEDFVGQGGMVIADAEPGIFDASGSKLARPLLAQLFPSRVPRTATKFAFGNGEAIYLPAPDPGRRGSADKLREIMASAGLQPLVRLSSAEGRETDDVETFVSQNGGVTLLALLRDLDLSAAAGKSSLQENVTLKLPQPFHVYDVRARRPLGATGQLTVQLGPAAPVVLALSDEELPILTISGPQDAHLGDRVEFRISPNAASAAARDIVHIDVSDPDGNSIPYYAANLLAPSAAATYWLPLAANDKPGAWTIRATDLLAGFTAAAVLRVSPEPAEGQR